MVISVKFIKNMRITRCQTEKDKTHHPQVDHLEQTSVLLDILINRKSSSQTPIRKEQINRL